jgi:hypothetical protein
MRLYTRVLLGPVGTPVRALGFPAYCADLDFAYVWHYFGGNFNNNISYDIIKTIKLLH